MLVELWAYLADVLTFYQERIANEAFLGTASLRDSLLRLVELIDYRPSPGAAASGWAAFTVAANQSLTVPAGLRIASRPQPGQQPVLFETAAPVAATAASNSIALSLLSPDIPFAPQTVVLQGASLGVSIGDYLVVFDGTSDESATAVLVRVTNVSTDPARETTTVHWQDTQNQYTQASKHASVYAFRVKAAPFGASAPLWNALSPTLTAPAALLPGLLGVPQHSTARHAFIGSGLQHRTGAGSQRLVFPPHSAGAHPGRRALARLGVRAGEPVIPRSGL